MKASLVGFKRLWRHRQLDELNQEMRGFQEAMQTRILAHLYKSGKAQEVQRREEFIRLDSTLQNFIGSVAKGVFDMSSLLSKVDELRTLQQHVRSDVLQGNQDTANHIDREAHDIREDIAQHHQQTQGVVRTGVNELKQFHVSAADLDRFKASLKVNGMDYRYNDVKGAHRETFEWVFRENIVSTVTSDDTRI